MSIAETPAKQGFSKHPIDTLRDGFLLRQRQAQRSKRTQDLYWEAITRFTRWLTTTDGPDDIEDVNATVMSLYFADLGEQVNTTTVAIHFRHLRAFMNWLVTEEDIAASPMRNLTEPKSDSAPVAVLDRDTLGKLLQACSGKDYESRRDLAIIRLFVDTGMRRGEMVNLRVADVDTTRGVLLLRGKTGSRFSPIGDRAQLAINRYLYSRQKHSHASLDALWLTGRGEMSAATLRWVIDNRCKKAGIPHIHPHQFRHTFAHSWRMEGGSDGELMAIAGWSSPSMLLRYGKSVAAERAIEAHRKGLPQL